MANKNFHEKTMDEAPLGIGNAEASYWASGYNACLEATNAAGLYEALIEAEKTIAYLQRKYISMEQKDDHAATRSGNARRKINEALAKAEQ